jgi:hypothetical protein
MGTWKAAGTVSVPVPGNLPRLQTITWYSILRFQPCSLTTISIVFGTSGHPHAPAPMSSLNAATRGAAKRAARKAVKAVWKTAAAQARVAAAATVNLDPTRASQAELQVREIERLREHFW